MAGEEATGRGWQYVGVGCLTAMGGFFGGGMIAVMLAKVVGGLRRCTPDSATGAPCDWFRWAVFGAIAGLILLPAFAIFRLRQSRGNSAPSQRG